MGRSVVRQGTERCPTCRFPTGRCSCARLRPVGLPFAVDVLHHYREAMRPTSTGHLIGRLVPGAGLHAWHSVDPLEPASIARPGHARWILHPSGAALGEREALPEGPLQVLVLDGNWPQSLTLLRAMDGWGRAVRLPAAVVAAPRYWLREAPRPGQVSTLEALAGLAEVLGREAEARALREALEWHVLVGLLVRGRHERAREFVASSRLLPGDAFSLANA